MRTVVMILMLGLAMGCGKKDGDDTPPPEETADTSGEPKVYDPLADRMLGGDRPVEALLPADYDGTKALPLVILLHGYGASGVIQDLLFQLGPKVDEDQFILVRPDGEMDSSNKRFWNATPECCAFENPKPDDVAYIGALIDDAIARFHVDRKRVAVVGHSNGGYMAYRMACERSDVVKRAVVLAGGVALNESACPAGKAVAITHIHGTGDDVVPYLANTNPNNGLPTLGARAAVERFVARQNCDAEPTASGTSDLVSEIEGNETRQELYEGCDDAQPVRLWSVVGEGHYFLRATQTFRDAVRARAIDITP